MNNSITPSGTHGNCPFKFKGKVKVRWRGRHATVTALLTQEAVNLLKEIPEYVFGQAGRENELFVICRHEDHYGRPHFAGKMAACIESKDIPRDDWDGDVLSFSPKNRNGWG